MQNEPEPVEMVAHFAPPEFVRAQLDQAIETYRSQYSTLLQISTTFAVIEGTLVGYVISTQIAGVLFVGVLVPLTMLGVIQATYRLMLPVAYTAITLEQKYGGTDQDWLTSTFVGYAMSPQLILELMAIASLPNYASRIDQLHHMHVPTFPGNLLTKILLALLALAHIIVPFVLTAAFHWRLF
jgi:hypothetical protein